MKDIDNKEYIGAMGKEYPLSAPLIALKFVRPGSRVLSVGCGAGREVRFLVRRRCKVTAIDNKPEMIKLSSIVEPRAFYKLRDASSFVQLGTFDYIVCLWNVINYMKKKDRKKFIENCYINLKPGGRLILTTSHIFQHWKFPLTNIHHLKKYYYFPGQRKYWFKDTKFEIEKVNIDNSTLIVARRKE